MSGAFCPACGMDGCGSRMCRVCRLISRRMTVIRYPLTSTGEPDRTRSPVRGRICGFITGGRISSSRRGGRLEIEGRASGSSGGSGGRSLTLIAGAPAVLRPGDLISDDGAIYRVVEGGGVGDTLSVMPGGDAGC